VEVQPVGHLVEVIPFGPPLVSRPHKGDRLILVLVFDELLGEKGDRGRTQGREFNRSDQVPLSFFVLEQQKRFIGQPFEGLHQRLPRIGVVGLDSVGFFEFLDGFIKSALADQGDA